MNLISVRTSSQQIIQNKAIEIEDLMAFVVENQSDDNMKIGFSSNDVTIEIEPGLYRAFEFPYPYRSSGKLYLEFENGQGKSLIILHQPIYQEKL